MNYADFIARVQRRGGPVESGRAEVLTAAVVRTLSEHLDPTLADDMASQLPHELKDVARSSRKLEPLSLKEFLHRIAQRADTAPERLAPQVNAVMVTLREALSPGDFKKILSTMPPEYVNLMTVSEGMR